ncbi:MAG: aminotransferase class V-fold PLP-dependent enzyme [Clostridia bacterium]|nr:aminotransferase class V-fold PLP-dependent enzyme [Clostridia bacterium]
MIYLDNGATSFPKPRRVHAAYARCMQQYAANAGRGAHRLSVLAAEQVWETRTLLAKLFHIPSPERIAFTQNCTEAINTGMKGLLRGGDDIVISDMEHNSVYRPAMALEKKGIRTLFARSDEEGRISPEAIIRQITPRTRMICIQHASNVGGGINPIREIGKVAREHGILFMVDAAQTAGSVSIDVERDCIDLLAFPGHKGLLGPQGTGGLYVRKDLEVSPLREGGTGGASESPDMPDFLPERLEGGTINLPGIAGLAGGVQFVLEKGPGTIGRHEQKLVKRFIDRVSVFPDIRILGPVDNQNRAGVVSIVFTGKDSAEIAGTLDKKFGIAVRSGLHCSPLAAKRFGILEEGSVRISPGFFNTTQEMDYAAWAIGEILKKQHK